MVKGRPHSRSKNEALEKMKKYCSYETAENTHLIHSKDRAGLCGGSWHAPGLGKPQFPFQKHDYFEKK